VDASPIPVSMRNDSALASRWFWSLCHGKPDESGRQSNGLPLRGLEPPDALRPLKRHAIVLCFLKAALVETTDAVVEMQDTRRYSPKLLEVTPFRFDSDPALGKAVAHLKEINRDQRRKLTTEAPTGFLPRRWAKYVTAHDKGEPSKVARPSVVTAELDRRVPGNSALSIDAQKGEFHLAALKGADKPDELKTLKELIESRLPRTELVDVLIDMDHRTDFLRHFLHYGAGESRLPAAERRRNSLAVLIAIGCNIGPQRMAVASGLTVHENPHRCNQSAPDQAGLG
jgi:hypothetical protein